MFCCAPRPWAARLVERLPNEVSAEGQDPSDPRLLGVAAQRGGSLSGPLFGVYGAAGCGRGVMPLARQQVAREAGPSARLVFIDDVPQAPVVNGHQVLTYHQFLELEATSRHVTLAIADGGVRERLASRLTDHGIEPWSVAADNVLILDDVVIGEGAILGPFVIITSNIRIGRHFHAHLHSYVEHDCIIGDYVTFAPGVRCNGNIVIEDHAYVGSGAVIKQGRPGQPMVIGRGSLVGMGAVVTKPVPPGATVVGNPARPLERR